MTIAAPAFAQPAAPAAAPSAAQVRAQVQAYLDSVFPADGPGAAVIVLRGDEPVYVGGRGLADVAGRRPITRDTVFRFASITKQFTAAVILQLVQEGRISLDDPISRFFPDYPQPGARATVRQLLNHTTGIQSYTDMPAAMVAESTTRARTTAEMIAWFRDVPSPSQPGTQWSYNNSGYVLLGAIIEQVTGMPWHEAVRRRISQPLGLPSIGYALAAEGTPAMAHGYTENGQPAQAIHMSVPHAAGALSGNIVDLGRWLRALHHGRVLNQASYAQMIAPTRLPNGRTENYGFGIGTATVRGHPTIGHNGGIFGFNTDSLYMRDADLTVAILVNTDDPPRSASTMLQQIAAIALGNPFPTFTAAPVDVAALQPLFGVYALPDNGGERRFFARDGRLYTQRSGARALEVFRDVQGRYFYGPASLSWFTINTSGAAPVMEFHANGEDAVIASTRTGPIPPQAAAAAVPVETLRRYVGRYTGGPLVLTVALGADNRLTAQIAGQPAFPLTPLGPAEFRTEGVDARVTFDATAEAVRSLTIHQGGGQTILARQAD